MNNKPFGIFLLTAALIVFFLEACKSDDGDQTPTPANSAVTQQDPDSLNDLLAEYITRERLSTQDTNHQINKTLAVMNAFDSVSVNFKRDSFEIEEKTTEGGELIAIRSPLTELIRIDGELFGEMGKLGFSFYMLKLNKTEPLLYCAIYKNTEYDKPLYEKDMKMAPPIITYEIYSENHLVGVLDNQRRKMAVTTELLNKKEEDTRRFVKDYLRQADIFK